MTPSPLTLLAAQDARSNDLERLRADSRRLDRLIAWLSFHDDLEGSDVRDWTDPEDARRAIDEAVLL